MLFCHLVISLCMYVCYVYFNKDQSRSINQNRATRLEIVTFEKYCDLETGVRGHRRSLEMSPFDTAHPHATSY